MVSEKGIFIAERMASTKLISLLRSARQETEIENGSIVTLKTTVEGEDELYNATPVEAATDEIYFVDGVEVEADEQLTRGLDHFVNQANKAFRARKTMAGDIFSISESMITGEAAEGKLVEPVAGNKLTVVESATAGATVYEVKKKWLFGTRAIPMVRLEAK